MTVEDQENNGRKAQSSQKQDVFKKLKALQSGTRQDWRTEQRLDQECFVNSVNLGLV